MVAAVDTWGKMWYSLSQANSNSASTILGMTELVQLLDDESPGWRSNTLWMWENAPSYVSTPVLEVINRL